MAELDKAIVTSRVALRAKYGESFDLAKMLKPLLDRDKERGLSSRLIDLADAETMRKLGGKAVRKPADPKQNKDAVDAVFAKLRPDYLLILGSVDVVPHQDLRNPTADDGDTGAPGDLPYACEARYSKDPAKFRAPTRVVGRLPDLTGATDPKALRSAIATAAKWKQRPRRSYDAYLGLSAEVWKPSTKLSLTNSFGSAKDLKLSPPSGPGWQKRLLARRSHFINCHGATIAPQFYGQRGNDYPVAHDAALLQGKLSDGTVAAVECCYGAELYDPGAAAGQAGIVSTYMLGGAYGFLGASTIAYGPAEGNGSADLICQYFLQRVLAGASLGRAVLEARQRFVRDTNVLDPADMKTLAQFSLMGDPSIVPVKGSSGSTPAGGPKGAKGAREARRANLLAQGLALEASRSFAKPRKTRGRASRAVRRLPQEFGLKQAKLASFDVERPAALRNMKGPLPYVPDAIHVLVEPVKSRLPAPEFKLVVAAERGGQVVSARELYSR